MLKSTVDLLFCPQCRGPLDLQDTAENGVLDSGRIACRACRKEYPIEKGTLHLASTSEIVAIYPEIEQQGRTAARLYDSLMIRFAEIVEVEPERAREEYMDHLELVSGGRVLDIGVGTGGELGYLLSKVPDAQLFGIDISIDMLLRCRRKLDKMAAHADLFLGFAEHLPFEDDTFDVVFHTGSINVFEDRRRAIEEMVRVAKPGTRIVISDEWITPENIKRPMGRLLTDTFPSLPHDVVPPIDLVPAEMKEKRLDTIWGGYGYCLHFRKPG